MDVSGRRKALEDATLADLIRYDAHAHQHAKGNASSADAKDRLKDCEGNQHAKDDAGQAAEAKREVDYQGCNGENQSHSLGKALGRP